MHWLNYVLVEKWQLLSFLIWRSVIVINLNVKVKLIQHPPSSQPNGYKSVTIQNGWNNRISDGCVYAQIRRGLGMHLVIYSNHDTVLFLLIVPIKGRLSEMEFIVSIFINACTISLFFLNISEILCVFQ